MKIKGRITILINRDFTEIHIEDDEASIRFAEIRLTPEQLSAALSKQAMIPCDIDVVGLDKIGKTHENKMFEFEIPKGFNKHKDDHEQLREIAQQQLTDGWIAENHFNSQDSFFTREGKQYARVTIRRWV